MTNDELDAFLVAAWKRDEEANPEKYTPVGDWRPHQPAVEPAVNRAIDVVMDPRRTPVVLVQLAHHAAPAPPPVAPPPPPPVAPVPAPEPANAVFGEVPSAEWNVQTLLGLEAPKGYCVSGMPAHLAERTDLTKHWGRKYSCHRWACPVCGPRNRLAHGLHFAGKILRSDGALIIRHHKAGGWAAGRKWLNRHRCSWVRVVADGEACAVFASMPIPDDDIPSEVCSGTDEMIRRLGQALRTMEIVSPDADIKRLRPVTSSYDWKLPERAESTLVRLGWIRGVNQADEAIALLRDRYQIIAKKGRGATEADWGVVFNAPPEFRFDANRSS